MQNRPLVSVVLPCLNEEEAIGSVLTKIQHVLNANQIEGEIIVSDNGSEDSSVEIAEGFGVRVVHEPQKGYGSAYLTGFANAQGRYIVMGDADDTYDFGLIPRFLELLSKENYDFVTGSRYLGKDNSNIPLLHRYFGNPALTWILNQFFGAKYTDVYCGLRAFSREAYMKIRPISTGMEFNLELAINAKLASLKTTEIPITLATRKGLSKLRTFSDGWRSLRMMLLYSPNQLFVVPGLVIFSLGVLLMLIALTGWVTYHGRALGMGASVGSTLLCLLGFQILNLGLHAKTYSWSRRFDENNQKLKSFYARFTLEKGILLGLVMSLSGSVLLVALVFQWFQSDLRPLLHPELLSVALLLIVIGTQIVFSSLFISAMSIGKRYLDQENQKKV
jgi:glycosyltransferase involved in cell wall biosynthesis